MAIFLDIHKISQIGNMIDSPMTTEKDFGVTRINTFVNRERDLLCYLLEAPNEESVKSLHLEFNLKCDLIMKGTMAD
ncbi:MAG: hypothetical protein R3321_06990 [Nitrososphaeraceae archaeon]|nr:hypothetical protein [Nitrososphaeraceae archaeon]